jgi:Transposase and inactivated derivatives
MALRQGSKRKVVFFMTYFIGIDIAKFTHYAAILDEDGQVIEHAFSFENNKSGFDVLLSKLPSCGKSQLQFGFESTAHYHQNLAAFLTENGYQTSLINPLLSKRFRGFSIRDIKNDAVDAMTIASFMVFQKQEIESFEVNELKELCLMRDDLIQKQSRELIRLNAMLDKVFPEFKPFTKTLKTKGVQSLLKKYSTATEIKKVRVDALANLLNSARNSYSIEKVSDLKALAKISVGFHSTSISFNIKTTITQLELLREQITQVDSLIVKAMKELESPILNIPGMGYIQAAYILSVIVNISRFSSPSKLLAFAGLDPKIRQSGIWNARSTRMSKRGNKLLRYALIWSANNVRNNSNTMDAYYSKKRAEGKSHYNALGHCAKKLVNYIFFTLNNPESNFILD